jgi:hypothetical protein
MKVEELGSMSGTLKSDPMLALAIGVVLSELTVESESSEHS